eukprot:CAMPEP_0170490080 /NCGR_PEP_ID=MMETSP0208-20121228/8352_1 /TAXON_ID=197538 /ORGANISM="Strombidium inclinatum, Strain S3" /LENGTH=56 /DNA_ID=CAMNT_0010765309 /DNA_START=173 /DNA_END=343 /DNA_ORIENTATION=+
MTQKQSSQKLNSMKQQSTLILESLDNCQQIISQAKKEREVFHRKEKLVLSPLSESN